MGHSLQCSSRLIWANEINKRTGERKKSCPPLACDCGFAELQERAATDYVDAQFGTMKQQPTPKQRRDAINKVLAIVREINP